MIFLILGEVKQQEWIQHTFHSLHPKAKYKIVNWSRLSGMLLIVCIKECYVNDIKNVAIQTVGTGSLGLGKIFKIFKFWLVFCTKNKLFSYILGKHT